MDQYLIILTIIGAAAFGMAFMPAFTKWSGISYALLYIVIGFVIYSIFSDYLPNPLPNIYGKETMRLTELVVIISLMGAGIKLDRRFSFKAWASPLKLVLVAMIICIIVVAAAAFGLLGFDLAAAVLLAAVLAPTDPVLAADVQVGPPNDKVESETKFALTAEAGLNDGMAFPFTFLAITLAGMAAGKDYSLTHWLAFDLVYKILIGIALGYLAGKAIGFMVFRLGEKYKLLRTRDGFLALSVTLLLYGLTEMIHGYGFIAVFVCAINLRHAEKRHEYHEDLHSFTDQTERLLIAVLLLLFGGAIASGILAALTWEMALLSILLLLLIRPASAFLCLYTAKIHWKEKLAISFFGIRGMGSLFYLAFALNEIEFNHANQLWAMVCFTVLISIVIHGITATPIINYLKKRVTPTAQ